MRRHQSSRERPSFACRMRISWPGRFGRRPVLAHLIWMIASHVGSTKLGHYNTCDYDQINTARLGVGAGTAQRIGNITVLSNYESATIADSGKRQQCLTAFQTNSRRGASYVRIRGLFNTGTNILSALAAPQLPHMKGADWCVREENGSRVPANSRSGSHCALSRATRTRMGDSARGETLSFLVARAQVISSTTI